MCRPTQTSKMLRSYLCARSDMYLSLRAKLAVIVSIGAIGYLLSIVCGLIIDHRVREELTAIKERYVPRVEIGPRLTAQFEKIHRGFQDAVSAHDIETLEGTHHTVGTFFEMINATDTAIDASATAQIRAAVN